MGKTFSPVNFLPETTTLWSFRDRGSWAVHDGHYRGNWSPYIPRNLMLLYSETGDTVLDCFMGGGTTAIESLLLNRNFIGRDINPESVRITSEAVNALRKHAASKKMRQLKSAVSLSVGDARSMEDISDKSIDLVCTHPPYAEIIHYSSGLKGDMSSFKTQGYLEGMTDVAKESLRVMKPAGRCAVLLGDKRKEKKVVPLGFRVIQNYLDSGFRLEELIIKRQFKTRTSGLWYNKAIRWKFLLMAHEYLPVFSRKEDHDAFWYEPVRTVPFNFRLRIVGKAHGDLKPETATVWGGGTKSSIVENFRRFSLDGKVSLLSEGNGAHVYRNINTSVILDLTPEKGDRKEVARKRGMLVYAADRLSGNMRRGELLGVTTEDVRSNGRLMPMGLLFWKDMSTRKDYALREIVIKDRNPAAKREGARGKLKIAHGYLLIYEKT